MKVYCVFYSSPDNHIPIVLKVFRDETDAIEFCAFGNKQGLYDYQYLVIDFDELRRLING